MSGLFSLSSSEGKPLQSISMPYLHPVLGDDGYYIERLYELMEPYIYSWIKKGVQYRLIVPRGFHTDIASVPILFWSLDITPDGRQRAAAVLHDWLFFCEYYFHGVCPPGSFQKFNEETQEWEDIKEAWTIEQANKLFGRVLREAGVNIVRRRLMYLGVSLVAWSLWKEKEEKTRRRACKADAIKVTYGDFVDL